MISYYKSKHPGLFLYLGLVILSVLAPLFIEISAAQIGILSILWGGFIFMRTLSLYEVSEHFAPLTNNSNASKSSNLGNSALPNDLMRRMSSKNNLKRGIFAMHSMHIRTLLWFALGVIYVAYNFYLSQSHMPHSTSLQNLSIFFIVGAAFWTGQTYAYSDHASKLLILTFTALLAITLFKISGVVSAPVFNVLTIVNLPTISNSALPILAALMAYSAAMLCYSARKGLTYGINAALGLTVIMLLIICGLSFEPSPQTTSIWISGWSLLSIFWVRSYQKSQKVYALYQCE